MVPDGEVMLTVGARLSTTTSSCSALTVCADAPVPTVLTTRTS
jgi:hypothetical protein